MKHVILLVALCDCFEHVFKKLHLKKLVFSLNQFFIPVLNIVYCKCFNFYT